MLKTASKLASYAKQYIARGYTEDLATATAKAWVEGDFETVNANERSFEETLRKQITANKVGEQMELSGGQPPKPEDQESATIREIMRAAGVKG